MLPCDNARVFRRVLFGLLLVLLMSSALAAQQVRVLLDEVAAPVAVQMQGAHRGYVDGAPLFDTAFALEWPVVAYYGQIYVDSQPLGSSFTLEPTDQTPFYWNGQPYRGALRFVAEGDTLKVINVIEMELYLRGVVPVEMFASWPLEALKAQAVASRSYTMARLDPEESYDVCGTQICQEYGGMGVEQSETDRAVSETAGLVVTYRDDYARTVYHADSGGIVASSEEVWGGDVAYLVARKDAESSTPHRSWEARLDPAQIAASLTALGRSVGTVSALHPISYSESGRVIQAEIRGSTGRVTLAGVELRNMLRGWGLKSTRFQMTGSLTARGNGWGHGVGMSQYGARALAEAGYSHLQILQFYYPNTEFKQYIYEAARVD